MAEEDFKCFTPGCPFRQHWWHWLPEVRDHLVELTRGKFIVDVGAGYEPFPTATEYVDWKRWDAMDPTKPLGILDLEEDPLPYKDKEVDFLVCRHTIEDLHYPFRLLREIQRVAKAGWIETPSPLAEYARWTSGNPCRGYPHHRSFVGMLSSGVLAVIPKLPIIEMDKEDAPGIIRALQRSQWNWNSYLLWQGDFAVMKPSANPYTAEYFETLTRMIGDTAKASEAMRQRITGATVGAGKG